MRLAFTAVLFCASAALAQNELPPTWSTSQGDSIHNQAKLPKETAAERQARKRAEAQPLSSPAAPAVPAPAAPAPPVASGPPVTASTAPVSAPPAVPAATANLYSRPAAVSVPAAPAYAPPAAPAYVPSAAPTYAAPQPSQPAYSPAPAYVPTAAPVYTAAPPAPAYSAPPAVIYTAASASPPMPASMPAPSRHHSSQLPPPGQRAVLAQAMAGRPTLPAGTLIDISAPLDPRTTPVYEGNPPIQFSFTADMDHGDALDLSLYSFGSHTGTHIDAPLHFLKGGATIDQVPLPQLTGRARVIDVDPRVTAITAAELERYNWRGADRILFRTRNSVYGWIVDPVFHRDFVYIAPDAAELMAASGVELVGIDYLSVEQFGAAAPQAHINMLRRGCIIAEGLDLRSVAPGDYKLTILPLRIMGHEAAPARAMLEVLPQ